VLWCRSFGLFIFSVEKLWQLFCQEPEGKFLVTKFEFGGSFGMSLEEDYHEIEVTPNLELLVSFDVSLEGVCHELYT
jgi:hypothetical protein